MTPEKFTIQNFMKNHFSYSFWRVFNDFFLNSLAAIVWEIEIPPPKKKTPKFLKKIDRIASKFAGMLEQLSSPYMKTFVMMGLVGTLHTELS